MGWIYTTHISDLLYGFYYWVFYVFEKQGHEKRVFLEHKFSKLHFTFSSFSSCPVQFVDSKANPPHCSKNLVAKFFFFFFVDFNKMTQQKKKK